MQSSSSSGSSSSSSSSRSSITKWGKKTQNSECVKFVGPNAILQAKSILYSSRYKIRQTLYSPVPEY